VLLNDFAAQALALPALASEDLWHLGGPRAAQARQPAPRCVLGPGTGLGVAALLSDTDPVVGEGGHVTLAAVTEREWRVLGVLRARYGHVSAERVISGMGLVDLHAALVELDGGRAIDSAREVVAAAERGEAPAVEALALFFRFLGTVAADAALTFGARGGVYLSGGILPRMPDAVRASDFYDRFLSKGRFRTYLETVPVHLVVHSDPAFLGLAERARALQAARHP
jgi:glucokinase